MLNFNDFRIQNDIPTNPAGIGLINLIQSLGKEKLIGLEIGCSLGHTTTHLLYSFSNLKLYGIDPYIEYTDWNGNYLSSEHHIENLEIFNRNISPFENRHILYREKSDDVVEKFEDEFLDFIFIDGLHEYDQVLKDCRNYYSKVKSGGIFSGHDYTVIPGVNRAVIEFAQEIKIPKISSTNVDVWYWIKP